MSTSFEMVAKTFQGLEDVLADELRTLGAENVLPGKRMVSFTGDLAMLYKANMCCRTALRILKPFYTFEASDADELYTKVKEFDWSSLMSVTQTFSIDSVVYSNEFRNSQFVTYRVKDGIVDRFRDTLGDDQRPSVRLDGADIMFNVHIAGSKVTLSLDSSGESLHKRGWRQAQTEAPINEVLAAGIILMSGWRGDTPFIDPMCGSGTFLIEAAMIAAGINPGIYRKRFAFENWRDFDASLLESIYNDDSNERQITVPIIGADISPKAIAITQKNAKSAGLDKYITIERKAIDKWQAAAKPAGLLVTNPPYGKRIGADDMHKLYSDLGKTLKHIFTGYHCWIIGYDDVYFHEISLAPSQKIAVNNGGLDCELREYVIFEGKKSEFRARGGLIKDKKFADNNERKHKKATGRTDKQRRDERKPYDKDKTPRKFDKKERPFRKEEVAEQSSGHRPLRLDKLGRQPSIPVEKEIVLNRPVWRVRKKKRTDLDSTTDKTNTDE